VFLQQKLINPLFPTAAVEKHMRLACQIGQSHRERNVSLTAIGVARCSPLKKKYLVSIMKVYVA
jgi:hypothetical protein